MSKEPSNVFTGRPFSLLVRPSDITAPPVHNMNRFNPYTSAEKVDLGQELIKLREESINLPPLPIDSEQLRVYVRLRPTDLTQEQIDKTYRIDGGQRLYVSVTNAGTAAEHELRFSHIFSCKATQQEVFFGAARPLVFNFIGGDNALIFAYGCTSSGKTFTIEGTRDNPGVLPRCVQTIFCQLNIVEQHRLQPIRFNEFNILSARQAEIAASEKAALFNKIHAEGKNVHFEQDPSTSCFFPDVLQQSGRQCSLFMGFVEIYNNNVYDLLGQSMHSSENTQPFASKNAKQVKNVRPGVKAKQPTEPREALQVGEDAAHNTYVKELRWVQVGSAQEALDLVAFAQRNMTFASTFFNMNSSRSHVICFIRVAYWNLNVECDDSSVIQDVVGGNSRYGEEHYYETLEVEKSSVMAICDLAGSERQPAQNQGPSGFDRLREAGSINTDLLTLGQCLTGMHNNQIASRKMQKQNPAANAAAVVAKKKPAEEPVPYRSCRLTYLLKAFLVGGRARVAMISAIVPTVELMEQNLQVLRYAAFASEVVVYRKLEPAIIEKFQKAKQKQQTMAVAKAARRLSQAPKKRAALAASVSKKGRHPVSEGTPITEELVKIQEEMGDALDAQMVVMHSCGFPEDNGDSDEEDSDEVEESSDDEEDDDDSDEECEEDELDGEDSDKDGGDNADVHNNLSKSELIRLLRGVCMESKKLHGENLSLKQAKEAAELEAKRQRGYYEMVKEKYKDTVEELQELQATKPSIDQSVDTEGLRSNRSSSMIFRAFTKPLAPALREEKTSLIAALGLAEPSLRWHNSQKLAATTLWADEESSSKAPSHDLPKRKIESDDDLQPDIDDDRCNSPTSPMSKRSRLEMPPVSSASIPPNSEHRQRQVVASPSPMPINKFSTHTKASILRMRMHQANVIKERHNAVQMKTPVLHPSNPDDLSLDEVLPTMPAELARRLEQIQMLKHALSEVEQQRDALQHQLEEAPSIEKFRRHEETLLKLKADLEFEKQLCQQNASEAETLRCQNIELSTAFDSLKKVEHSLSEQLTRSKEETSHLKERISELQHDLQVVYEELNGSRAGRENESLLLNEQLESLRTELTVKESELKALQSDNAKKSQDIESLKLQQKKTQQQCADLEKERHNLLEEARHRQEHGNATMRMEELQFDVDEATVELETIRGRVRSLEETNLAQASRLAELENLISDKEKIITTLKSRRDELEQSLQKNIELISNERDAIARSKQETIQILENDLRDAQEKLSQKAEAVGALKEKMLTLEYIMKDKSATDSALSQKLEKIEAAYDKVLSDLSAKSAEAAALHGKIADLEQTAKKIKDVEAAYDKALTDLSEKSAEASSLYAKISDISLVAKDTASNLQSEIALLKSEVERLSADLVLSNAERQSLVDVLIVAKEQASNEKNDLIAANQRELAGLESKISELEADICSKNADYDHLSTRFASVEAELIDARQEIDRCRAEFDDERSILTKSCEEEARALLDAKSRTITSLESRLNDAEQTISNLRSQTDELVNEHKKNIERLTEKHAGDILKIREDLSKQHSEKDALLAKQAEIVAQCKTFKTVVSASMEQAFKLNHQSLGTLGHRLDQLSDRLGNYEALVQNSFAVLDAHKIEQLTTLEDKIKNISEHKDAVETALNGRINLLEVEVKEGIDKVNEMRKLRDAARDNEERSLRNLDVKSQEVDEMKEQLQTLNDHLATASNKVQELQEQIAQKNIRVTSLTKDLERVSSECTALRRQLDVLQEAERDREQQEKSDSTLIQKMTRELAEKRDVIVQKNARIDELEKDVKRLFGNVERLESVLATKEAQIVKLAEQPAAVLSGSSEVNPAKAVRGQGKRVAKRKQDVVAEQEQEPSDSEIDALVQNAAAAVQLHGAGDTIFADSVIEEDSDANKRRRRRGAASKEELPPPQSAEPAAVGRCTRAQARGRQRTQRSDQHEEADENPIDRPESVEPSQTTRGRKRGADQHKNLQSMLIPPFDNNDGGSYV